jgi:hypothetical protein
MRSEMVEIIYVFCRSDSRIVLTNNFNEVRCNISINFFTFLIFWYFSPAPALCGDQGKSSKKKSWLNKIGQEKCYTALYDTPAAVKDL